MANLGRIKKRAFPMAPSSSGFMRSRLIVETNSPGWHKSMIKILSVVEDASYNLDAEQGCVLVRGKVDSLDFMKMLAKVEEHIQLHWIRYEEKQNWDNLQNEYGCLDHTDGQYHCHTKYPQPHEPAPTAAATSKPCCCTVM